MADESDDGLTIEQRTALALWRDEGATQAAACRTAGRAPSRWNGWLDESEAFRAAVEAVRRERRERVDSTLDATTDEAARVVRDIVSGKIDAPVAVRARCAELVLSRVGALAPVSEDAAQRERRALEAAAGGPERLTTLLDARVSAALGIGKAPS